MSWRGQSRSGRKWGRGGILMRRSMRRALKPSRSSTCSPRRRIGISGQWCMCCGRSPGRSRISPSSGTGSACTGCTCRSSERVGSRFSNTIGYWRCANLQQRHRPPPNRLDIDRDLVAWHPVSPSCETRLGSLTAGSIMCHSLVTWEDFPHHITVMREHACPATLERPRTLAAPSFFVQRTTLAEVRDYSDRQFSLVAVVLLAPLLEIGRASCRERV